MDTLNLPYNRYSYTAQLMLLLNI